jgi:hypothetical protein
LLKDYLGNLEQRTVLFQHRAVKLQFCHGEQFKWPTSLIHKITDDVRFAKSLSTARSTQLNGSSPAQVDKSRQAAVAAEEDTMGETIKVATTREKTGN